jgi:hypothetical protein
MLGINQYSIGNSSDGIYGYCSHYNGVWTFSAITSVVTNTYIFKIYEEQAVVSTLDEKYLPESVVLESELEGAVNDAIAQAVASGEFNGKDGTDGISPTVSVDDIANGHRVTITDKEGAKTFDVMDGKDGQGGGVTSWNDLTDKPFYYNERLAPITWDGNADGRTIVTEQDDEMRTYIYVKVSDRLFTEAELKSAILAGVTSRNGKNEERVISNAPFYTNDCGVGWVSGVSAVIVASRTGTMTLRDGTIFTAPEIGTYFSYFDNRDTKITTYMASLTFPNAIKLLDEKYLPESVVLESELDTKGYQTESQVTKLINNTVAGLPDYLETLGYQTEAQVTALINNALGVIENGTY